ncbi:MAG: hypothetical protein KKC03_13000, partial [Bacteroidetes bacterium]|nr:hypothetical protein [Bacteroidota bacterium]
MKNKFLILVSVMVFLIAVMGFVAAANSQGILQMWRNATTGANVTWVDYNGNIYTLGDINISGIFYGNGSQLTGILGSQITNNLNWINETTLSASETDPYWTGNWTDVAFINKANAFGAFNQSFDTNVLFVDSSTDRVGIGTTGPGAKLHSLATTEQLRLGYDSSKYGSFTVNSDGDMNIDVSGDEIDFFNNKDATGYVDIGQASTGDHYFRMFAGGVAIQLRNNGDSYFNAGNVGIGTTTPTGLLHLYSTTAADNKPQFIIENYPGSGSYSPSMLFRGVSSSSPTVSRDVAKIYAGFTTGAAWGDANIHFQTPNSSGALTNRVVIRGDNGNVGIGTTIPQEKLHVAGNSIFNGTINIDGNKIINLGNGTAAQHAVTLSQLQAVNTSATVETDPYWTGNSTLVLYTADEPNLNVNSSNYWDGLNTPFDILGSQINNNLNWINWSQVNNGTFILSSNEGNLNVNSSDYWVTNEGAKKNVADILGSEITNNLGWINSSGTINNSNYLGGYPASFFMPLNTSVYGQFDFNGGWTSGGLSIINGNLYAQEGYF